MATWLIVLIVLVLAGAAVWYFYGRDRGVRPPGAEPAPVPPATPSGGVRLTPDLQNLKPRDAVSFWDGTDVTVRGSLDCQEQLGGRTTEWRWVFLSGDRMLEVLPHGQVLYEGAAIAHQGDEFYQLLVGPGGSLKRFEGNVREGIAHEPVLVEIDGISFRIRSTGTFSATRVGELPEDANVWSDVSSNASDNVYFKLVPADAPDSKDVALGVWTTHILISRGRALDRSEITGIYAS